MGELIGKKPEDYTDKEVMLITDHLFLGIAADEMALSYLTNDERTLYEKYRNRWREIETRYADPEKLDSELQQIIEMLYGEFPGIEEIEDKLEQAEELVKQQLLAHKN